MAKKNHHPVSAEVENNPLCHDTYKLLRCYRDSTYSLMVAVRQVEIQFQLEYNTSVDEFLDSIYAAGADLGDSQIEEWAKSIARSNKMIKLLLSSVDLLRKNHKHGEEYYWILYYAFLSPHELKNTEEILEELEKHVPSISYRTYYRRRQAAINALSSIQRRVPIMDQLSNFISEYLKTCETIKKLNSKTIKAYRIDLSQFHTL